MATTYTLKAVDDFLTNCAQKDGVEIQCFPGALLDYYLVTYPDGYKWKYVMIDVMYIDCWNSVYTIKRSNKAQVAEAFCKQHQESEDVAQEGAAT